MVAHSYAAGWSVLQRCHAGFCGVYSAAVAAAAPVAESRGIVVAIRPAAASIGARRFMFTKSRFLP